MQTDLTRAFPFPGLQKQWHVRTHVLAWLLFPGPSPRPRIPIPSVFLFGQTHPCSVPDALLQCVLRLSFQPRCTSQTPHSNQQQAALVEVCPPFQAKIVNSIPRMHLRRVLTVGARTMMVKQAAQHHGMAGRRTTTYRHVSVDSATARLFYSAFSALNQMVLCLVQPACSIIQNSHIKLVDARHNCTGTTGTTGRTQPPVSVDVWCYIRTRREMQVNGCNSHNSRVAALCPT